MSQKAGQNKAVNHVLATASPEYQQKAALYDFLVENLMRDPRVAFDQTTVDRLGRASALVRAESTALFEPRLNTVMQLFKDTPNLEGASLQQALAAATSPINTQNSQFRLQKGWHGGEVHHNVGAAGIAAQTSALPYQQWGTALNAAGQQIPITSQAFNGTRTLSGPGHNIAHYDPIAGIFNKGDGVGKFGLILPNGNPEDMAAEILDAAESMRTISQLGAEADDKIFSHELAARLSEVAGREIMPRELNSTLVSPFGNGISEAGFTYALSTPEMVRDATIAAFGAEGTEGASAYMTEASRGKAMASAMDLNKRRNAKARASRAAAKSGESTPPKSTPMAPRPDADQMADQLGVKRYKARFI